MGFSLNNQARNGQSQSPAARQQQADYAFSNSAMSERGWSNSQLAQREQTVSRFVEYWNANFKNAAGLRATPDELRNVFFVLDESEVSREEQLESGNLTFTLAAYGTCSSGCAGAERTERAYTNLFGKVFNEGEEWNWVKSFSIDVPYDNLSATQSEATPSCFAPSGSKDQSIGIERPLA